MLHSGPTLNTFKRLRSCAAARCFHPAILRHTPVAEAGACLMSDATTVDESRGLVFCSRATASSRCFFVVSVTSVEVTRRQQM